MYSCCTINRKEKLKLLLYRYMFKNIKLSSNSKQNNINTVRKLAKVAYLLLEFNPVKIIKKLINPDNISIYTKLYSNSKYTIFRPQYTFNQNR